MTQGNLFYVRPSTLKPYENNPRKNDSAVDKVAKSIQEFGFQSPIIVDKNMVIIVGHTRWKAALKLNLDKVPVIVADLPEDKAKAYRIADNRTHDFSYWDWEKLEIELEDIETEIVEMFDFAIPDDSDIPEFDVKVDDGLVTEEDVERTKAKLESKFKSAKEANKIICPKCGHEFEIS